MLGLNALSLLQTDLLAINTPSTVIDAITHGIIEWGKQQQDPNHPVHALTRGSLNGPDMLITMAFTDQLNNIGWSHLLLGRVSRKWGAAAALYGNKQMIVHSKLRGLPRPSIVCGNTPIHCGAIGTPSYMEPQTRKWLTRFENKLRQKCAIFTQDSIPHHVLFYNVIIISSHHALYNNDLNWT